MKRFFTVFMSFLSLLLPFNYAWTNETIEGLRQIYLQQKDGAEQRIGEISFKPTDQGGFSYSIKMDHHLFKDYFLSMKEMKCLEGPELWCFIPYPYDQPKTVSGDDLRWLEHDLLFMFKQPEAFGANFWNGIYYKMEIEGQGIRGVAHSLDLNMLASPPEDLSQPPIGEFDIDNADLEKRWLPFIDIR